MKRRIRWVAGPGGIAHAHLSARVTVCGALAVREHDARRASTRCPACLAVTMKAER